MNPYEAYKEFAASILPRRRKQLQPRVVKSEREAPMVLRGAEKAVAENDAQFRRYKRLQAAEREKLLAGPHGKDVSALILALKYLTPDSAPNLFRVLEYFAWFEAADADAKQQILSLIDEAICRMRVQNGLPPIDDSLPGEEPTVFEICRANLGVLTP
jgi:hypothetical protein